MGTSCGYSGNYVAFPEVVTQVLLWGLCWQWEFIDQLDVLQIRQAEGRAAATTVWCYKPHHFHILSKLPDSCSWGVPALHDQRLDLQCIDGTAQTQSSCSLGC
ncbi:Hypothetical predicted protein [Podarcis lilfordi]|uniref:Uncharacterized protein n=1 Tax=Podarcis lilfordi TaxID=74358 RepID=A0AA35JY82_9SAUR|nr:Hypothetical predicted protein [Podarcis lilfordi]